MRKIRNKKIKFLTFAFACFSFFSIPTIFNLNNKINTQTGNIQHNNINEKTNNSNLTLDQIRKMNVDEIIKLDTFDGRKLGITTPVRDQGREGICWAFALAGTSETNMLYKQGALPNQYNKENLYLSPNSVDRAANIRNGKVADKLGLTNEDNFNNNLGSGTADVFLPAIKLIQQNAPLQSTTGGGYEGITVAWLKDIVNVKNDITEIKKAIAKYGSVAFTYISRYLRPNATHYYQQRNGGQLSDHASVIVGWDDNIDKDRFLTNNQIPKNNGGWIVKNSWGDDDFENGYFYLSYDSFIEKITALNYGNKSDYENLYYYDGMARAEVYGNDANNKKIKINKVAAIFPTKKASETINEKINAVTFGIKGKNAKVKISIYDNVQANANDRFSKENRPTSGVLVHSEESPLYENAAFYGGIYTHDLQKDISLTPNSYFSIVYEVNNDRNDAEFLFSDETSTNDLTFYEETNSNWSNCGEHNGEQDWGKVAAVKAITITEKRDENINDLSVSRIEALKNEYEYDYKKEITPQINVFNEKDKLINENEYIMETSQFYFSGLNKDSNVIGSLEIKITPSNSSNYIGHQIKYLNIVKAQKPLINFGLYENNTNTISINVIDSFENRPRKYSDIKLAENWIWKKPDDELVNGENQNNQLIYQGNDKNYFVNNVFNSNVIIKKEIVNINDNSVSIQINKNNFEYTSSEIKPELTIKYNDILLNENEFYNTDYINNINAGQAKIIITGLDYFDGQKIITFEIEKATNKKEPVIEINKNEINIQPLNDEQKVPEILFYSDKECKNLIQKPTTPGKYYFKLKFNETENYNEFISNPYEISLKEDEKNNINTIIITSISSVAGLLLISISSWFIFWNIKKRKNRK